TTHSFLFRRRPRAQPPPTGTALGTRLLSGLIRPASTGIAIYDSPHPFKSIKTPSQHRPPSVHEPRLKPRPAALVPKSPASRICIHSLRILFPPSSHHSANHHPSALCITKAFLKLGPLQVARSPEIKVKSCSRCTPPVPGEPAFRHRPPSTLDRNSVFMVSDTLTYGPAVLFPGLFRSPAFTPSQA
ncbi:hypothetical protein DFH09DRAFT_1183658, partial [Mycena vulgaris]